MNPKRRLINIERIKEILSPVIIIIVVLMIVAVLIATEMNGENMKSLFNLSVNIQRMGFWIGLISGTLLMLLILLAINYYREQKSLKKSTKIIEERVELYNPQNDNGVIKPLLTKAEQFIDQQQSPLIPLINKAQSHLLESKDALDQVLEFKQWGNSWQNHADGVLSKIEVLKNIITSPSAYMKFLNSYNGKECHLKIMGSMAGFLCLFPLSLRNFICAYKGNVTIDIIGTGVRVGEYNLALYPLAFVSKTMVSLFDLCDSFQSTKRKVAFNIYHYPYDIIEAIFIISDKKLVNVQSLSPNNIEVVFKSGQMGLVFSKEENQELFERYNNSFENIKSKLDSKEVKLKETWELTNMTNSNMDWNLTIKGKGHWKMQDNQMLFIENEELADLNIFEKGTVAVRDFLYKVYDDPSGIYKNNNYSKNIRFLKTESPKIHDIDVTLREEPDLSKISCACGWNNYNSIN